MSPNGFTRITEPHADVDPEAASELADIVFDGGELAKEDAAVLSRKGVRVLLEEAGSVIVRVLGLTEHDATSACTALRQAPLLLERKICAICNHARSVAFAEERLPRATALTFVAVAHVAPLESSGPMRWRFVPYDFAAVANGSIEHAGRLASVLTACARRAFRTRDLLVWFGVPEMSVFDPTLYDPVPAKRSGSATDGSVAPVMPRFADRVEIACGELFASKSLAAAFVPVAGPSARWLFAKKPTGRKVVNPKNVETASGFFVFSTRIDVKSGARFVHTFLKNACDFWREMPSLPVGENQRLRVHRQRQPDAVELELEVEPAGSKLDHRRVVVIVATFRALSSDKCAEEFAARVRLCERLELLKLVKCGASDARMQEIINAAHEHAKLRAVVLDAATCANSALQLGAKCVCSTGADDENQLHLRGFGALFDQVW